MFAQCKLRPILLSILVSVLFLPNCGETKTAKSMMVVENGQAKLLTLSIGEDGSIPLLWEPGTVVLFRTTEIIKPQPMLKMPAGETGKAGEVYVVTNDYKLRKIGDLDLKKTDQEFREAFSKY